MKINKIDLDGLVIELHAALEKYNAKMVSVTANNITVIVTSSPEGAEAMKDAWNEWSGTDE